MYVGSVALVLLGNFSDLTVSLEERCQICKYLCALKKSCFLFLVAVLKFS